MSGRTITTAILGAALLVGTLACVPNRDGKVTKVDLIHVPNDRYGLKIKRIEYWDHASGRIKIATVDQRSSCEVDDLFPVCNTRSDW